MVGVSEIFEWAVRRETALFSAAIATIAVCLIASTTILNHLRNFTKPALQKRIIRVILTAPIFSIASYFSLLFPTFQIYFATVRDFYEVQYETGYVLFQFFSLLLGYLGGENAVNALLDRKGILEAKTPCCCCPPIELNRSFLLRCKRFILQFVWIVPFLALTAFVLVLLGEYQEGQWTLTSPFAYMSIGKILSTMSAMFHLVQFYRAFAEELEPFRPLGKFACIKIILFLSFWLRILFSILIFTGVLNQTVTSFLKDFFVCFEMLVISLVHSVVYGHEDYIHIEEESGKIKMVETSLLSSFLEVLKPTDLLEESLHSFRKRNESEKILEQFLSLPEEEREKQVVNSQWFSVEFPSSPRLSQWRFLILLSKGWLFVVDSDPLKTDFDLEDEMRLSSVSLIKLEKVSFLHKYEAISSLHPERRGRGERGEEESEDQEKKRKNPVLHPDFVSSSFLYSPSPLSSTPFPLSSSPFSPSFSTASLSFSSLPTSPLKPSLSSFSSFSSSPREDVELELIFSPEREEREEEEDGDTDIDEKERENIERKEEKREKRERFSMIELVVCEWERESIALSIRGPSYDISKWYNEIKELWLKKSPEYPSPPPSFFDKKEKEEESEGGSEEEKEGVIYIE